MRVCNGCNRHTRTEHCPFCGKRSPRLNAAALVISASFGVASAGGPLFDRIFSCNNNTVVAPYGAPQIFTPDAAPIITLSAAPDAGKSD